MIFSSQSSYIPHVILNISYTKIHCLEIKQY